MALVALMSDPVARGRVVSALRELTGEPCTCLTTAEVRARLRAGNVRALVLEVRDRDGAPTAPMVAEIRRDYPSVRILAYCMPGQTPSAEIVRLIQAGVHQLVLHGMDDERHALRAAFHAAEHLTVAAMVLDAIGDELPPSVRPLVDLYLKGGDGALTIADAARQLGVHRKTLRNRMHAAGLPAPAELRAWCRLFLAAELLQEPGRTVESIALQLDFPSASALRNLLKRRTALAPHALRAAGGLPHLLHAFRTSCDTRRQRAGDMRTAAVVDLTARVQARRALVAETPADRPCDVGVPVDLAAERAARAESRARAPDRAPLAASRPAAIDAPTMVVGASSRSGTDGLADGLADGQAARAPTRRVPLQRREGGAARASQHPSL